MNLSELKKQLLANKKIKEEFEKKDVENLAIEIGSQIFRARTMKGFTQARLARKMNTKQPSIARAEGGNDLPSLSFLQKMAEKLGTYLIPPKFAFLENINAYITNNSSDMLELSLYTVNSGQFEKLTSWEEFAGESHKTLNINVNSNE